MVIKYKRAAAFICPFCSKITVKSIMPFSFSGRNSINYICSTRGCREECGRTGIKGSRYATEIECPVCGERHSFSTKYNNFWHNANIIYKCPNSDISIFFIGSEDDKYPEKMLKEYNETFEFFDGGQEFSPILADMIDCLDNLDKRKKISCVCGSKSISYEVEGNDINIVCRNCRRLRAIEINEVNLAMLLNAEAINIEN